MSPNDAARMANSVDPDQTAPLGAVWSGSALFTEAYLSKNLGHYGTWNRYFKGKIVWLNCSDFQAATVFIKKSFNKGI